MTNTWFLGVLLCAASLLPAALAGQAPVPGTRVRVTAADVRVDRRTGELLSLDADSLVLRTRSPERWVVPRDLLRQVEVSGGRQRRTMKGMAVGAALGLGIGLLGTGFGGSSSCEGSGDSYGQICAALVGASVLGGGLLGAGIGSLVTTERWVPLPEALPRR